MLQTRSNVLHVVVKVFYQASRVREVNLLGFCHFPQPSLQGALVNSQSGVSGNPPAARFLPSLRKLTICHLEIMHMSLETFRLDPMSYMYSMFLIKFPSLRGSTIRSAVIES